ncbi:L-2-hydroxycarboxylate dehydrogenase (NAD(P)(+)) [uncultured archaeon]|nr:L-2-hydroxycarboxylate dehydrogenase (NAD(P)(+)) [uncultured archaeon]
MKISIIGAGRVGSTTAFMLMNEGLADEIVLIDVEKERAEGEALDLLHSTAAMRRRVKVTGGDDYALTKESDLVILTAGLPRKMGETRLDLAKKNAEIVLSCLAKLKEQKPKGLLMVTNPVDSMTYIAVKEMGDAKKVFGLGTTLDSIRYKSLVAGAFKVSVDSLDLFILGEHGDTMFPYLSHASADGITLAKFPNYKSNKLTELFDQVITGGIEVIKRKGGTVFAPSLAIVAVVESMVHDRRRVLPVSVYDPTKDVCVSVPSVVSKDGATPIAIDLDETEQTKMQASIDVIRHTIEACYPLR